MTDQLFNRPINDLWSLTSQTLLFPPTTTLQWCRSRRHTLQLPEHRTSLLL